jgi:hypothetical protein
MCYSGITPREMKNIDYLLYVNTWLKLRLCVTVLHRQDYECLSFRTRLQKRKQW